MKKIFRSDNYNFIFDDVTGFFARWGKTKEDDPTMCPFGPEIADIEISTICNGIGKTTKSRKPCSWCYKSNTGCGKNMSFETFKTIFHKFPKTLTQIAFGIGDIDGNPDLWKIMDYCRNNNYNKVIPNITTNGMGITDDIANKLAKTCGAVAVSHYHVDSVCYDAVKKLTDFGLKQVNIHKLLADQSYDSCFKLIDDVKNDPRLTNLKAIVFLKLKPKGDRNEFKSISSIEKFNTLIKTAQDAGIQIGMDSCSAPLMLKYTEINNQSNLVESIEPCESGLFSIYCNVDAEIYPCSFSEKTIGWENGISMLNVNDFIKDVWFSDKLNDWRNSLIKSSGYCNCSMKKQCRSCPIYNITECKK